MFGGKSQRSATLTADPFVLCVEARLFASKVSVETSSITPNSWTASWTLIDSLASASSITLKCVSVGDSCDAVADAPLTVVGPLKTTGTVEGLYPLNSYWCYAITKGKLLKKPVCSDPVVVNTPQRSQVYSQDFFYPPVSARAPVASSPVWDSDVTICQFNSAGKIDSCMPSGLEGYNVSFGVIRNDQRYGWWVTYDTFAQSPQLVTKCALEPTGQVTSGTCSTVYDRNDTSSQVWSMVFNADQTRVAILSQSRGLSADGDAYLTVCDVGSDASFTCISPVMVLNGTGIIGLNDLYYLYIDPSENYLYITGQTILGAATGVKCSLQGQSCGPMVASVAAATRTNLFIPSNVSYPEINAIQWVDGGALVSYRTNSNKYLMDLCAFDITSGDFVNCSSVQADPSQSYLPNGRPWYVYEANQGGAILVYGATGRASLHLYLYTCPVQGGLMGPCELASNNPNVTGVSFPIFNGIIEI